MTYHFVFPAYPGHPFGIGVAGPDGEAVWFETRGEALLYLDQMNNTPEWQAYCRDAVEMERDR